jgi:hypothetical protein
MFLFKINLDITKLLNSSEYTLSKTLGKVVLREKHPGKYFSNFEKNSYFFYVRMSRGKASSFTVEYPSGKSQSEFTKDLGFDLSKAKLIHRNRFGSEYLIGTNIVRLISWDGTKINSLQFHSKTHRM